MIGRGKEELKKGKVKWRTEEDCDRRVGWREAVKHRKIREK